jgi:hypothetical protein
MVDPRGNRSDQILRRVGLLHAGSPALALRMLIDQLTPHLPKDNEEVNAQVMHLQAMLDAATMVDPVPDRGGNVRGQDPDHR